jgi:general secretion pathway protein N
MTHGRIAMPVAAAIWIVVAAGCDPVFAAGGPADFGAGNGELDGKAGIVPSAILMPPIPAADDQTSAEASQRNPLREVSVDALHATRERPLFSPSRRPPAPVVASVPVTPVKAAAPVAATEPTLSLLGIVAGKEEALAVFINTVTHDTVRLKTGEGAGGWILRSINGREAVIEKDHRTEVLKLPATAGVPK